MKRIICATLILVALCATARAQTKTKQRHRPQPTAEQIETWRRVARAKAYEDLNEPDPPDDGADILSGRKKRPEVRDEPKPLTIPAREAAELERQSREAREATTAATIAQLKARVAFLEALLRALGIDLNAFEVSRGADGSVVLTPKKGN